MTLEEALGSYLGTKTRISATVRNRMAKHFADFAAFLPGKTVDEITVEDVQRFATTLAELNSATRNGIRGNLIRSFKYALQMEWTKKDPCCMWDAEPVIRAAQPVFYSKEQRTEIIRQANEGLKAFFAFSFATGIRQGTVRLLVWKWITKEGVLEVPEGAVKNRVQLRIPLSRWVLRLLGPRKAPGSLIFPDLPGQPTIWKGFRAATWKAGIRDGGKPRDMRATFANSLMQAGAPLSAICRLGGWNNPQTVMRYYASDVPDKDARKYLEEI